MSPLIVSVVPEKTCEAFAAEAAFEGILYVCVNAL
jgi:hypothetical protein